jgi:hypothetical protein
LEKIKHGFKTLAECGGIRGVDDTSSSCKKNKLIRFSVSITVLKIIDMFTQSFSFVCHPL